MGLCKNRQEFPWNSNQTQSKPTSPGGGDFLFFCNDIWGEALIVRSKIFYLVASTNYILQLIGAPFSWKALGEYEGISRRINIGV